MAFPPETKIQTIVVADSNPANLDLFESLLAYEGYEVICVNDGEEALKAVYRSLPNLLITEVALPKVDGLTLSEKIRSDKSLKWMPLLAITALRQKDRPQQIEAAGFDGFLVKPFKEVVLKEIIRGYLEERREPANLTKERFCNKRLSKLTFLPKIEFPEGVYA